MAIDERARHELYQRLEETLGVDLATTLMEHLPPTGWADVATKSDLAALAASTKSDIGALADRLEVRFARIDARFDIIDERFAGMDTRLRSLDETLDERIEAREQRLLAAFRAEILNAVTSQTRPF